MTLWNLNTHTHRAALPSPPLCPSVPFPTPPPLLPCIPAACTMPFPRLLGSFLAGFSTLGPSCPDSLLPLGILWINHRGWAQWVAVEAFSAPSCVHVSLPLGFLRSSAAKPCPAKMLLIFAWIWRHSCDETFGSVAQWHTHTKSPTWHFKQSQCRTPVSERSLILTQLIWLKSVFPEWERMGKSWISLDAFLWAVPSLSTPKAAHTALCSVGSLTRDCGHSYCRHFRNISIAVVYLLTAWNSSKQEMLETHLVQILLLHQARCSSWSCWASPLYCSGGFDHIVPGLCCCVWDQKWGSTP